MAVTTVAHSWIQALFYSPPAGQLFALLCEKRDSTSKPERWGQEHKEKGVIEENHRASTELEQVQCNKAGATLEGCILRNLPLVISSPEHPGIDNPQVCPLLWHIASRLISTDDLAKEVETSFIFYWRHFIHSGGFYQGRLVRVEHLIFLSFLSSGQAFFSFDQFQMSFFFIRSDRKAKLPICREWHLKGNISAFELIQPKVCDVTWKRDVLWMFALSSSAPWAALPGRLLQDHWSQKLVHHWAALFFSYNRPGISYWWIV